MGRIIGRCLGAYKFRLLIVSLLAFSCTMAWAVDAESSFTLSAMKECVIPEVNFTSGETLLDVMRYFRDYPLIQRRFGAEGKKFDIRVKRDSAWPTAANGSVIPPKIDPYRVKNVSLYHALKSICLRAGYRFSIEKGVVRVVANRLSETPARNWTARNGQKMFGRWAGLLANGAGIVVCREKDKEYVYTLYKNLSQADLDVVNVPGEKDFHPYYYMYGGKKLLNTDHNICSPQEALREQRYIDRAVDLIEKKSYLRKVSYQVFQCCDGGALCVMWNGKEYNGEIFFLPNDNVADEDKYTVDYLLWLGTYTYQTVQQTSRTVNVYSTRSIFSAVEVVRRLQGFFDRGDRRFERSSNKTESGRDREPQDVGAPSIAGSGSGVIVTKNGYLLTNAHVVEGARKVEVVTVKGKLEASVVRVDSVNDLALLKMTGVFKPISFSSRRKERLGASVFTLGFPRPGLQGFEPKITKGIISGLEGFRGDVKTYQIDAAIQPGNSGGLLADEQGNLVGIVSSALVNAGQGEALPQNVNYAIKKSYVLAFVDAVPECSDAIIMDGADNDSLEEAVQDVRDSCALIIVYK